MRKIYLVLCLVVTGLLFAANTFAQISVTATAGTTGPTTYTTLQDALAAINAGTHQGAINVSVTASTTEITQSSINSSGTGSASYTSILIKPAAGATPTITETSGTGGALLTLIGADNVTIDGSNAAAGTSRDLTITNQQSGNSAVILIASNGSDGATNNVIKNCNIAGTSATGTTYGVYAGSISLGSGASAANSNNLLLNNSFTNTQIGISVFGYSTYSYDQNWGITNNDFNALGHTGVRVQNASTFTITNNTVSGMSSSSGVVMSGIELSAALATGDVYNNNIGVIENTSTTAGCAGMYIHTTSTGANINIYNNYIHNIYCTGTGAGSTVNTNDAYGLLITQGGGFNIYFNTILSSINEPSGGYASGPVGIASTVTTAGSIDLRDNILVNTQTGGVTHRAAIVSNASNAIFSNIDYNDYYATSGTLGYIGGISATTIAEMSTYFGGNTHSTSVNPVFVAPSEPADLDLQNVAANGPLQSGIAITSPAITTDIHGHVRSSTPVIGANEVAIGPVITYSAPTPSCGNNNIVLSGVNISDYFGVPTTGSLVPRIYFKKNSGAYFSAPGTLTSGTGTSGTWSFTISAATLGGLAAGNTISYYIIAQNTNGTVSSNPSAGLVASNVNTVTTPPTTPNTFTVSAIPTVASLTPTSTTTCVGTPVTFNAGTASGTGTLTSYTFSGPNSFSSTGTTPSAVLTPTTTTSTGVYSLTVTYPGTGCTSTVRTASLTVNAAPAAITGTMMVCPGMTTTLADATSGGTWSSSAPGTGTVNTTSGVVGGVAAGITTISYTVSGVCVVTAQVTVNPLPAAVTGTPSVCAGSVTTLADGTTGGTFASSNTSIATVNATTGDVTGAASGTATISYTLTTGCYVTRTVTVNALPGTITGTPTVCTGATTTLNSTPAGGTWSSDNTSIATAAGAGVITGVGAGVANITYTLSTGCVRSTPVTVNPSPAAITGPTSVCSGTTITLTDATTGGNWTPTTGPVLTVNSTTGVVTGVSIGTVLVSYTLPTGCRATYTVMGLITPPAIAGTLSVCEGGSSTLTNSTTGGTWSSSNPAVATVGVGTGLVTATGTGVTTITYTVPSGCFRTAVFTVNPQPAATTGPMTVCVGANITLDNTTGGGTWTSSDISAATVGSTTGIVHGVNAATAVITYRLATGCQTTNVITVNPLPANITGTATVCQGLTTNLADATTGGTWSSLSTVIATVGTSGTVTGVSAGNTTISYTLSTGCYKTTTVTVNPSPAAITGTTALCVGTTTTLADGTGGGTWSSSAPAIASIASGTGILSANAAGNATITYRLTATGCLSTTIVTVNGLPPAITGTTSLCTGSTTTLSDAAAGGTWLSANTAVATVSSTGVVSGIAAGTSRITYTLATGCATSIVITVNSLPATISGIAVVCEGSTTNFTSTPGGGTWSSSDPATASVGAVSGVVTGVAAGVATITYNISTGCIATTPVTVNPLPLAITGANHVCVGSTTSLSDITGGGSWSSSNVSLATVGSGTGVVTGVGSGVVLISYTLPTGCARTISVTVDPLPSSITGPTSVCLGSNITLMPPGGGTWSSTDPTIATVGSTSGIVTGVSVGTATISFIISTGCYKTQIITVNPVPAPISGSTMTVCTGSTITLTDADGGGSWSPTSSPVATVGVTSGIVSGISPGTVNISYTFTTGCRATTLVTVYSTPPAIGGTTSICPGTVTTLSNGLAGGTWSTSNASVVNITTTGGVATGIMAGTATISYTTTGACTRTVVVTVNPAPAAITGASTVCIGSSVTFTDVTTGGSWYSSATTVATAGLTTGVITGVSAGSAIITYRLSTGCNATQVITVNPLPNAIAGASGVCVGNTLTLTDATAGGTWTSSNPGAGSIDMTTGTVTGIAAGTTTITYTIGTGCYNTKTVSVNPNPSAITGIQSICVGNTTTLANSVPGGAWSSDNTAVATIGAFSGVVTGGSAGMAGITYTLSTGCLTSTVVTVNAAPAAIAGTAYACVGNTSALTSAPGGGVWSSSNTTVATVDATTGVVTAIMAGNSTISYTTTATGCYALRVFTVQPVPSVIAGTAVVCTGLTTSLSALPTGGAWTSSNSGVASVSATGVVSGITAGIATISYSLSTGCYRTQDVTVNPTPSAIMGNTTVCVGATSALTDAASGGTWISGNTAVATVNSSTGVVTGIAAGSATISYTLPTGCRATAVVTVQGIPATIGGTAVVCEGGNTTLTDATAGGTWISSNTAVATIGSGSGILVGLMQGTTNITYTITATGCQRIRIATVNAVPAPITGATAVCAGSTTTLSSTTLGGSWTSGNTAIATVGVTSGTVTGVSNGVVNITYAVATGCITTYALTVNPLPAAISGTASLCVGSTTVLSDGTGGGTWSSSNTAIGTVNMTTGVVSGISVGNAIITYALGTSCAVTRTITVNPMPSAIVGILSVCAGSTTSLSDLTPGGSWSSSNTFVATVGSSSGIVSGATAGIATISYTLSGTGCMTTADVTVNPVPFAISGATNICVGSSASLASVSSGGSWISSNSLVATIGSSTGVVTGVAVGTARITYILATGCQTTTIVTVSPVPADIAGVASVCQYGNTTLTDATTGGNWSSSSTAIATVSAAGVVTGVAPGVVTITYTLASACTKTISFTVNPAPAGITGTTTICKESTTTLSNTSTGGVWTSSNTLVATITTPDGLLTGVNPGTSTITYSLSTGCKAITVVSVSPLPAAITGPTLLCEGSTITLSNTVAGGTWTSDNTSIAFVGITTGVVTGAGAGTTIISYTTGICSATLIVTVNPAPPGIVGDTNLCVGETSHLTDATSGGTWSSSNTAVATIGAGDGVVTGVSAGTSYITYTLGAGCKVIGSVTVNTAPAAILGPNTVCAGQTITLTDAVAGGTWISDDVSVASIGSGTGVVTGVSNNIDTIRYTLPGGCTAKFGITVNATPAPISGMPLQVCQGLTTTLTDPTTGGEWTSSNSAIAPVDPVSGVVSGVAPGTVTISYTITGSGCAISAPLTVNPTPAAITGMMTLCQGTTSLLSTTDIGGTWSSSNMAIATIGSGTGMVTGFSAGTTTVTYTAATGCITTALVVVNPSPAAIGGAVNICVGSSTTLTDATPFGTWSISNTTVASIDVTTGLITGLTANTATVTYTLGTTGCFVTQQVTVNPVPPPVLGNPYVCVGSVTFLTNAAAPGGTWSSSDVTKATVDGFGNVSGVAEGTTNITYTLSTACYVSTTVTVEPIPAAITGPANVCVNATITLADTYSGGVWTSGNTSIATVGSGTGLVTGELAGAVNITYSTPLAHCYTTHAVTVDAIPAAISGPDHLCEGTSVTYFESTTGGTWTSSNTAVATIGAATGTLNAITPDTLTIAYTTVNGCFASKMITVNPLSHAGAIFGPVSVCATTTITLQDTTAIPAGRWSSSNTSVATVDTVTGVVTGVNAGTAIITYISSNECSSDTTTAPLLVNPQPDAGTITGTLGLCKDYVTTLSSTVAGGTWTSGNTAVATVDAAGVVTAVAPGTVVISYSVTNVCGTDVNTVTVTVNLVAPHSLIAIHPDSVLCMNTLFQNFGTDTAQGAGLIYTWSTVNAELYAVSADKKNSLVSFHNSGIATVKLVTQIANTGCFVTDSFTATIGTSEAHSPEIKYYDNELICTDNTADSYQWGFDDVTSLDSSLLFDHGFNQQAYYLPVPDFTNRKYFVITKRDGCMQKTYYNAPTLVAGVGNSMDIRLYPNPADATINILVSGLSNMNDITIKVVDMLGKEVATASLVNGKGTVDVSNMAGGVYSVLFISNGEKIGARTFVKK